MVRLSKRSKRSTPKRRTTKRRSTKRSTPKRNTKRRTTKRRSTKRTTRRRSMRGGSDKTVIFYYMTGCGHCDRFKPVWEEFKLKSGFKTEEYDVTKNPEEIPSDINGFPTIRMNGVTYDGDRTLDDLIKWAKNS